jgi:glycerol-3-phosphate acyltransferase PlsX
MNIGLDMMGGDFAPLEAIKGLKLFQSSAPSSVKIFCIGNQDELKSILSVHKIDETLIEIIPSTQVIGYNEHPTKALKEKPESSISIGFQLLASGKIDALISAGNTGAMLIGAMLIIKPIEGILRPTIATIVPKTNGGTGVLLDVGLNAECKPEQLNQFAMLGSMYANTILGIANPKVGLINVGEEEGKGNLLAQATYPILKENPQINFIGNIEGRDFFNDKADVMVCDGFTGNIILKMAESFYDIASERKFENDSYIKRFHYENYGGTPILGISKPVIIGHGISNAMAFKNMLLAAKTMVENDLCTSIKHNFANH